MKQKEKSSEKLHTLIKIGVALSSEKELNPLLNMILEKSTAITQAQGAAIYLIREEPRQNVSKTLSLEKEPVFHLVRSYSFFNQRGQFMDFDEFFPMGTQELLESVSLNKEILNISSRDEKLNKNDKIFKKHLGNDYQLNSLLFVPMVTADDQVCGILQLVNKKSEDKDVSFDQEDEEVMKIFSTYAAIALENVKLNENIENLFESFVRASIKAIESRDPSTSGHSDRVAVMTVELALATHKVGQGPFKNISFSERQIKEIRYASLLHDFGKIGVRESVLLKKKKLRDRDLESLLMRFDNVAHNEEKKIWKNLCEYLIEEKKKHSSFDIDKAYHDTMERIGSLQNRIKYMRSHVITANEPQVMSEDFDINELVEKIAKANEFFKNPILKQSELSSLSITKGSLNKEERQEMNPCQSHL